MQKIINSFEAWVRRMIQSETESLLIKHVGAFEQKLTELEKQINSILLGSKSRPARRGHKRIVMTGSNIISIRRRLGLSQAAFARLLEIPPVVLWRWEHDKVVPAPKSIAKLMEYRNIGKKEVTARLAEIEQALYK